MESMPNMSNSRTNQYPWNEEIWKRIDMAVHTECIRTKVASRFLPLVKVDPAQLTFPSGTVIVDKDGKLSIREPAIIELIELVSEFRLTSQQVKKEESLMSAVTLATRSANHIAQAFDVVIFQGQTAIDCGDNQHPLFRDRKVIVKSGKADIGLLDAPQDYPGQDNPQVVTVPVLKNSGPQRRWGENTFGAVAQAYARLQSGEGLMQAHNGPYVLVLHFVPYADTLAPLKTTLIMPRDRIRGLVTGGYADKGMTMDSNTMGMDAYQRETHMYGTGTLCPNRGIFLSLGGNTMDLVVGVDAMTEYVTTDCDGNLCFRVFNRFGLRLKDRSSVIRLEFDEGRSSVDQPA